MNDYFRSNAIGSSLLAACIESIDPLVVCTDRATVEIKPTSSMETGKILEDFIEDVYGEHPFFWEKYFASDMDSIPIYNGERQDIKQILEILDNVMDNREFYSLFSEAYIYNAKPDKDGNKVLSKTYKSRHRMLNQIQAHDYRRPITTKDWEAVQAMFQRFQNHPFELLGKKMTFHEWISGNDEHDGYAKVVFQVPFFWTDEESGASCRAKFDMVWLLDLGEEKLLAVPFDLKKGADAYQLRKFWRNKYVWQSKHYMEGFKLLCLEKGYAPHDRMYYAAYESEAPYLAHLWSLHPDELINLDAAYGEALATIQRWIDDGKPIYGYMPQQDVNRYGKAW